MGSETGLDGGWGAIQQGGTNNDILAGPKRLETMCGPELMGNEILLGH